MDMFTSHAASMQDLLDSGKYADLMLVCADQQLREAATREIKLIDDDLETVQRLLSYLYVRDYRDESANTRLQEHQIKDRKDDESDAQSQAGNIEAQPACVLWRSIRVYAIADKYDVPPLKDLASKRYESWIKDNWACEELPAMAKEVFETTPACDMGLRELVASVLYDRRQELLER